MIFDPNPAARAKSIRADLAPVADELRQIGASVSIMQHPGLVHGVTMMVATPGRLYEEVVSKLDQFAARSGGTVRHADPAAIVVGDPDGECLAFLSHTIVRRRAA